MLLMALHRAIGWPSSLEDLFQPGDEDRVELEEAVNGALQLLSAHRIDVELDLLGLGEERGILERVRECLAQELHAIPGRPRGYDEGAGDRASLLNADSDELARLVGPGEAHRQRHVGEVGGRL